MITSTMVHHQIHPSAEEASRFIALEISMLIRRRAAAGKMVVLGLATGGSFLFLYRELVRMHREEGLSFANVISFNQDEYFGLNPLHPRSCWTFMHRNLFDHVDILPENIHIPEGGICGWEVGPSCDVYEASIERSGGIDIQILGIDGTGHVGFSGEGGGRDSRTMLMPLDAPTRMDVALDFRGNVPSSAITMGCGTILKAARIVVMAWGRRKGEIVREAFSGPVTGDIPASYLQPHRNVTVHLDEAASPALGWNASRVSGA